MHTLQMPTRQSPKFSLGGPFLLLEARFGLFLPSFFLHLLLLSWENKVNSYSNQWKLSWVCKLEWSLTKSNFQHVSVIFYWLCNVFFRNFFVKTLTLYDPGFCILVITQLYFVLFFYFFMPPSINDEQHI